MRNKKAPPVLEEGDKNDEERRHGDVLRSCHTRFRALHIILKPTHPVAGDRKVYMIGNRGEADKISDSAVRNKFVS